MRKYFIYLVLFLAFVLRFYRLSDYPAFNADEAAIGYNAYSLLETGKDEHGSFWPIHFQSFNDYKPGLYFYLVLPFVKLLGLSELAVRIPGATLGALSVLFLYFLVKELFKNERLALISSLFLAISPWHIHFSRGGWEVSVATFFIILGLYLFFKAPTKPKYFIFSFISFVLSLYTYHAARVVVPLLGLGLLIIYRNEIKKHLRGFIIGVLFPGLLLIPLLLDFAKGGVSSRAYGVGLFADTGPLSRIEEQRREHGDYRGLVPRLLHNKGVNYGLAFAQNLLSHFDGEFLFDSGEEIQRNKIPETGQMYLIDIILLLSGFVFIVREKKNWGIILIWLGVAPVAAALTFQSPHALRAQSMSVPLSMVAAFGFIKLWDYLKAVVRNKRFLLGLRTLLCLLIVWGLARYLHMYYLHMAKEYQFSSQYGVKELVSYVSENQDKFKKVWVTDRYDQPYILFLFYLKYSPEKFQENHVLTPRDKFGFSTVRDFDKYHFEAINFDRIRQENPNTLIAGTDEEIHDEANIVERIYGANGLLYFEVVAN